MESQVNQPQSGFGYASQAPVVAVASAEERAAFITKTYLHLFGAIFVFAALEVTWFVTPVAQLMLQAVSMGRFAWLLFMAGFVGVSMLANNWALSGGGK